MSTLLVMAAGMGSRYGGLKQLDRFGPSGETILEYSVYDAIRVGFKKAVFVIREDFAEDFKENISSKFSDKIEVIHVFQKREDLPEGYVCPETREKPWGTGQAVYAARDVIHEPFTLINADDFYGADAFDAVYKFLAEDHSSEKEEFCTVTYKLKNTLSKHGHVSRGVCSLDDEGYLKALLEHTHVTGGPRGPIHTCEDGRIIQLSDETPVAVNFFGFTPELFPHLEKDFCRFLDIYIQDPRFEFYLPHVVSTMIASKDARVKVLETDEKWFGVTNPRDRGVIELGILEQVSAGRYPKHLWGN